MVKNVIFGGFIIGMLVMFGYFNVYMTPEDNRAMALKIANKTMDDMEFGGVRDTLYIVIKREIKDSVELYA